ncbi:hypothetical protein J8L84_20120, partial [Alteromonas sp. MMG017]|uniref:hypothetical protein n=1 Tax=Alteromonas sp. MMG017 TaxID=2822692 RepID=UPI001B39F221
MKEILIAVVASLVTSIVLFFSGVLEEKTEEYSRAKIIEELTNDAPFVRAIKEKLNSDDSFSKEVASQLREDIVQNIFPNKIVLAINDSKCPKGWEDFKPSYGRFLRGIDPNGVSDIANRPPGDQQEDSIQGHGHKITENVQSTAHAGPGKKPHHYQSGEFGHAVGEAIDIISNSKYGEVKVSNETRPKNVAVSFCIIERS